MAKGNPATLYAEKLMLSGTTHSLALFRTRWETEGQMAYEATGPDDKIESVAPGAWFLRKTDDGPAMLVLEFGDEDEADLEMVDLLSEALVQQGAHWGFEARRRLS